MGNKHLEAETEQKENEQPFESKLKIHSPISYPKRSGNTIRTFIEGTDFYSALQQRCESAEHSIWCAVSFGSWDFRMVNGQYWWQFLKTLKQRTPSLTIRVLFWRNTAKRWSSNGVIMGTQNDADFIEEHNLQNIQFRWDESPDLAHCHHGKYFVIDAETENNIENMYAFVGGMTLNDCVYDHYRHDTVIEVHGPSTVDVMENFKLRWNYNNIFHQSPAVEMTKESTANIAEYGHETEQKSKSHGVGTIDAHVCCTFYPKLYPGYASGESSIHAQYYRAFLNAKRSIYIESQHPGEEHLLKILRWKLQVYFMYILQSQMYFFLLFLLK